MRVFTAADLKRNVVEDATVAILGYGNQGHAHALNLKDSGVEVVVGARRAGPSWERATGDGFAPLEIGDAVGSADYIAVLVPDEVQGEVFERHIRPRLRRGAALIFAHGFSITFDVIRPPGGHDVVLVAPKGQGHFLRRLYEEEKGLPCLVAVEQDASGRAWDKVLSYAHVLGCLRAAAIETTFREEAVTDLFGEQAVLCGGVPALVKAAFETLVRGGYRPEVAYIECLHELKIITDLMYRDGIAHMRDKISRTAAWGSFLAEADLAGEGLETKLMKVLRRIESGEFAEGWKRESRAGQSVLRSHMEAESRHQIEEAGRSVRRLMTYLKEEFR